MTKFDRLLLLVVGWRLESTPDRNTIVDRALFVLMRRRMCGEVSPFRDALLDLVGTNGSAILLDYLADREMRRARQEFEVFG